MNCLFYGFLLVFIDFNISIGDLSVNFLPDFVGFLLMMQGARELVKEEASFAETAKMLKGAGLITAGLYAVDLYASYSNLQGLRITLDSIGGMIMIFAVYKVYQSLFALEKKNGASYGVNRAYRTWFICAVLVVIGDLLMSFVMRGTNVNLMVTGAMACVSVGFIVGVIQLIMVYKVKKAYDMDKKGAQA